MISLDDLDNAASQVAGGDKNPIDEAAKRTLENQRTALKSSLYGSLMANPDMAARAQQLGKKAGIPADVAERNLPDVQRQVYLNNVDKWLTEAPSTAEFLSNPDNAKIAHDDVDNLVKLNRALSQGQAAQGRIGEPMRANSYIGPVVAPDSSAGNIVSGLSGSFVQGAERARQGVRMQLADALGIEAPDALKKYKSASFQEDLSTPAFGSDTATAVYGGGASLLRTAPGLLASILTRNATPTLAAAGVQTQADAYGKYKARGATGAEAFVGATGEGTTEVLTELLPMGFLTKNLGKVGAGQFLTGLLAREIPSEQVATLVQDAIDTAVANPEKTWSDYANERGGAAYNTLVATLVQSLTLGGVSRVIQGSQKEAEKAQQAEQNTEALTQLDKLATASKLRARDPDSFEQFVAQASADGPVNDLYISAQTLAQSGIAEQLAAVSPSVAAQFNDAIATGGDVRIPLPEYAARIAGTEYSQSLLDHLKTEPEGMSRAEAQQYMQTQGDDIRADVERVLREKQGDSAFQQSADDVKEVIRTELEKAGNFSGAVNDHNATLAAKWYAVTAAKLGVTPRELFDQHPLTMSGADVGGQVMGQISPQQAMLTNVPLELPTDPIFTEAVGNTPGAQITDNGLLIDLVRYQKPEQEGSQAIRTGVFYLPVGAAKHYKTGRTGYGGAEKHEGPTLIRRPLFAKGATGGKAHEAAYDMLKGKKAYQNMRNEVLSSWGYNANEGRKVEAVAGLLEKYNSLDSTDAYDQAYMIVANSKTGNTLPYAVQENIVAHAVRDAGYDAVVGYSKGKAGANISEVFDVREQTFPARGMESDVHDAFNQSQAPAFDGTETGNTPIGDAQTVNVDGVERTVFNSNGKPIHPTQEGVRNFWRWFGDSKVVDAEGRPLVVYHGTPTDFTEFKQVASKNATLFGTEDVERNAFFFSDRRQFADEFAAKHGSAGRVLELHLSMLNPADLRDGFPDAVVTALEERGFNPNYFHTRDMDNIWEVFDGKDGAEIVAALKDAGYNGAILLEAVDPSKPMRGDNRAATYAVFSPTQIKSATGNAGTFDLENPNILMQRQAQANRGSYNPATNTIALLENADLSTFLHESGHMFLELQLNLASKLQAKADLTEGERSLLSDTQTLLDWFGIKDLNEWHSLDFEEKRSHHEKFARGFEAYLFEGKAPSFELQKMFQTFRAWLLNIYKSLKALNVELTDEVRSVMDRMLATNEEIRVAQQSRSMLPLFSDPEKAGLSPEEFAAYHREDIDATNEAAQELQARSLRDMQWLHNARGREIKRLQKESTELRKEARTEVAREVMARPIYQAWQFLTAKPAEGVQTGKLNTDALIEMYGGEGDKYALFDWKRLTDKRMVAADGFDPNAVAEKFGFASGDELVRKLAATTPPNEEIEALTDLKMLEEHGELSSADAIARAADVAIHNSLRAKVLATEANALAKAVGNQRILASAAKEYAGAMIARLKLKDVKPKQYTAAEARAGKLSAKAFAKDDLATAATEKRNQLINHYAARAAYDAQDEIRKIDAFFKKVVSGKDEAVTKTRDMDMVNAARAVLANFGYGQKAKAAAEYLKAVEAYDPAIYEVLKASVDAAEALAKPADQLTVEELRGLYAEVDSLWFTAKRNRQMEIDGDLLDRQEAVDALRARMEVIGIPDTVPGDTSAMTPEEERALKIASTKAIGRRVESWVDLKDGANKMGAFRRFIWNPIKEAADRYRADKAVYIRQFRDAFSEVAPSMKQELIAAPELNYTFGKDSGGVAMNEVLHALLHTGNESNLRKLLLGRNWASETEDGRLDTSRWDAFIARMIKEGRLTKAHYDFVQRVWDTLEAMKPAAQKAHREAYGKYFAEVTANEINTLFGTYRGGYAPAQVDSRIVKDNELKKLIEEGKDGMAYAFPGTSKGFTKSRVDYNKPLMLDLRTLPQHIDKVLLFSHLEMPVRDVAKLIAAKGVNGALNRIDPAAVNGMLMPWLNRSARQQVTTPIAGAGWMMRMLNTLRNRTSMATMFANVSNTAQQVTGFSLAALKVKPSNLLSATADYMRAPKKTAQAVAELSSYMSHRMDNEVSAMMGEVEAILLDPNLYQKAQEWTKRHTFFMQSAVDNVMGPIIWKGAFNQALEEGYETKDAIRIADSTVRQTQGSTLPEDVSRIETGPAYARLFTQFAGYFNMQANLLGTEFAKVSQEMGVRKGMGKGFYIFLLGFYAPALVAEMIAQAFRGGPGDDDKDGEYLDDWLMSLFVYGPMRNLTAFVPFVGQTVNSAVARFNHNPADDKVSVAPVVGALEAGAGVPVDLYKAVIGEGNATRTIKDVATLISITTGLPASVAARPLSYMAGVGQDKVDPTGPVDLARGLITGAASPESKTR